MSFPIDVSRPFRYPSELRRLAEAVHGAGDYDETRWIEWKSTLDLQTQGGIHHIARQILGFANRDPQIAAAWAGGCAYLIIGVSPGKYDGITLIDPERLVSQIQPYVGADITWTPESIQVGGRDVLIVIVEPPQPGDPIHVLRKDLNPYRRGAVLIRRHGQVTQADDIEMAMLQRRLLARAAQIAVSVDPIHTTIEVQPHFSHLLDDWLLQERAYRLAARKEAPKDGGPYAVSGLFAAAWSSDPRSIDQYTKEVEEYIGQCRDPLWLDIIHHFGRHRPTMLALQLVNSCERNFSQVRVIAEIDSAAAIGFEGKLLKAMDDKPPGLPSPPAPLGTPMGGRPGLLDSLSYLPYASVVPKINWAAHGWHVRTVTQGIQRIEFDPYDLRPHETCDLPPVPLIVKSEPGTTLGVDVGVTATNVDGKWDNRITLSVSGSTFADCWPKLPLTQRRV